MRHYVTTAHGPLLPQLRALFTSMQRHCRPFTLHLLSEGREVFDWALEQGAELQPTAVEGFVQRHPEMAREYLPGPLRTPREVAITQRWTFARELLEAGVGPVTVIDCDAHFRSSPEPVFEEIGQAVMAVSPHSFVRAARGLPGVTYESHSRYALLNAGFVYFADLAPAAHFAELCREGPISFDRVHADGVTHWGEQGALEVVAAAHGAREIQHPGVNVGPWNVHGHSLERDPDGVLLFGGRPLVSYHFHSLRIGGQIADANYEISARQAELLYHPYLEMLRAAAI